MKKNVARKYTLESRFTYGFIGFINLCVLGMFLMILSPEPTLAATEPAMAVVSRQVSSSKFVKINLGIPTRIVVPSVGIDLLVKIGSYDIETRTWTLDTQSAFYADRSVPVNDSNGSTLLYGHARKGLFAKLPEITDGATAQVYTDSKKVFSYTFMSSRQVKPDDTSIFINSGPPVLALQTCSGPFDIYRTLVSFSLSGVSSI